jgi:tRNA nucleotidyltransferase (CCA-adding enzyme)
MPLRLHYKRIAILWQQNEPDNNLCYNSDYFLLDEKMPETANLADNIEKQLPAELVNFIKLVGGVAAGRGERVYLVGGVVRDLLLGKTNLDIDLVVEGDAIALARGLTDKQTGKITIHRQFNTAKLKWHRWSIDLATARQETYTRPGALPTVQPSSLVDDLFRRDFTINAMAIELNPEGYGHLIDPYSGQKDLIRGIIRILHGKSFIDDSTRIWRGLRYEQRLDFQIEPDTRRLLRRDIPMLDTISGDRIRYEIECILGEECPEKVFKRAEELGVLAKLNTSLKGNGWLAEKFNKARQTSLPNQPPPGLYMALLTYFLTDKEKEQLILYLRLAKPLAQTLRDSGSIKAKLRELADPKLSPSGIYHLLHGYSQQAIIANLIASDSPVVQQHIQLFLDKLRYVKPMLTGNDLIKIGISPGPRIKELLNLLLDARLDGKIKTRQDEGGLVEGWLGSSF